MFNLIIHVLSLLVNQIVKLSPWDCILQQGFSVYTIYNHVIPYFQEVI